MRARAAARCQGVLHLVCREDTVGGQDRIALGVLHSPSSVGVEQVVYHAVVRRTELLRGHDASDAHLRRPTNVCDGAGGAEIFIGGCHIQLTAVSSTVDMSSQ